MTKLKLSSKELKDAGIKLAVLIGVLGFVRIISGGPLSSGEITFWMLLLVYLK
jgi:hypothetical protein